MSSFLIPPPPPGLNYTAAIQSGLGLLLLETVFGTVFLGLLGMLLAFSTSQLRRRPMFIMNVIAVTWGILYSIASIYLGAKALVAPLHIIQTSTYTGLLAIEALLTLYIDMILLFRVYVVYPPRTSPWHINLLIFGPPIAMKFVRIASLTLTDIHFRQIAGKEGLITEMPLLFYVASWQRSKYTKISPIYDVIDNCWASMLFLIRIYRRPNSSLEFTEGKDTFVRKLRNLFYIASGSFVFPCLFSIGVVICLFHDTNPIATGYLEEINYPVQVIGVLVVTLWAYEGRRDSKGGLEALPRNKNDSTPKEISMLQFRMPTTISRDELEIMSRSTNPVQGSASRVAVEHDAMAEYSKEDLEGDSP